MSPVSRRVRWLVLGSLGVLPLTVVSFVRHEIFRYRLPFAHCLGMPVYDPQQALTGAGTYACKVAVRPCTFLLGICQTDRSKTGNRVQCPSCPDPGTRR